ncbi:MAG TPA: choice-of-anchor B family protein [Bacteroidia bacterium]|nr:choice-of-anchor B family protein [Bacteroidia bacterium]
MKKLFTIIAFMLFCAFSFGQNLTFQANLPYPFVLANIGGYVDSQGNEYALVGTEEGLSIVDVTTPASPVEMFAVQGEQSEWREVKTWQHYAYVTNEEGDGLQIINLDYLPDSVQVKQWHGNGAINNQLETIHALHIDNGYAYLYGSNLFNGAAVICDLNADPWNPNYLGHTPGTYIHDGYVRNDTLWAGHIYDGYFAVYNCANKANPVLLATQNTPLNFTHNTWLSADSHTLFTTDEQPDSYLTSYDVTDLGNIQELDRFQTTPGSGSIVHNTHIISANGGEFAVTSWYKDGVVITDVTRPDNMIQIGRYDTYTQGSGGGFDGDWGVYPYLPSGTIVASDMSNGLYVLSPNYVRACYLEGNVTDSATGAPLNNVAIQILTTSVTSSTALTGDYKTGTATAGTYDVQFSKAGYTTKIITGVPLISGIVNILDVELAAPTAIAITGQVIEAGTGNPIANAEVLIENSQFSFSINANATGNFSISPFFGGTYNVTGGKWGHRTSCTTGIPINGSSGPVIITLDKGYYDDFALDFGWTHTNAGHDWERGEPVGTTSNGSQSNPNFDVTNDCLDQCYVTDNGGGVDYEHDIDPSDGTVILTSPVFDLTSYTNPQLNYYRWFFNGELNNDPPNDNMILKLTNGLTTVTLETILNNTPGNSSWLFKTWNIASLITPTANMRMTVETSDDQPSSIVEGGLDKFEILETVGVNEISSSDLLLKAYPNPFNNSVSIKINAASLPENAAFIVTDARGKIMMNTLVSKNQNIVELGKEFSAGVYFVQLKDAQNISSVLKIVKVN